MKMKLEIHVKPETGDPIELTLEEAETLYKELGQIFGKKDETTELKKFGFAASSK